LTEYPVKQHVCAIVKFMYTAAIKTRFHHTFKTIPLPTTI